MPRLVHTEKWYCPNHHHCGAVAVIKTYACGCKRVEWIDRGRYDPDRCAPNPRDEYGPNHPYCGDDQVPPAQGPEALALDVQAPATQGSPMQPQNCLALTCIEGRIRAVSLSADGTYAFVDTCSNYHNIFVVGSETLELSRAVDEFEDLVNSRGASEHDFHQFFEEHPDFILGDDHRSARSHLTLASEGRQEALVPDFVLEPIEPNGLADLLELKLPSAKLVVLKQSRFRLSAAVVEACAQLRTYSEFFDESVNRDVIWRKYGLNAYRPRLFLVIGRRPEIDSVTARRIYADIPGRVEIRTYDDLLIRMRRRVARMHGNLTAQ